jgi:hypothetical protein
MINNMYRWVDPRVDSVRVADMRSYLARRGWKEKPYPGGPELLVFQAARVDDDGKEIIQVLPSAEESRSYRQRLIELITSLAVIEDRLAVEVLNDILHPTPEQHRNGVPRRTGKRAKIRKH